MSVYRPESLRNLHLGNCKVYSLEGPQQVSTAHQLVFAREATSSEGAIAVDIVGPLGALSS